MQKNEKIIIILLAFSIIAINIVIFLIYDVDNKDKQNMMLSNNQIYEVYQNDKMIKLLDSYEEALDFAKKYENASIKKAGKYERIYDNSPQYEIYQGYNLIKRAKTYKDAVDISKKYDNSYVFYRKINSFIYNKQKIPKSYHIKNVPLINQYPELPRGCEITSLAMLLKYKGINIDKMELAQNIKKEPFFIDDKKIYNGNPHKGFLGDMYSLKNEGYGVYNEPLYELFRKYAKDSAINITGIDFEDIYYYIKNNSPVLVIINTRFKKLPDSEFKKINTKEGIVKITYREHAVIITGYDEKYIYFNDPLYKEKNRKAPKNEFKEAFVQMGSQALTYTP